MAVDQIEIYQRAHALRVWMKERGLDGFVVPSSDPHDSEYTPAHWKSREWLSGFTGSAGTAVVTLLKGGLWTDSRYFIAAAEQLRDGPFELMKQGVAGTPSIADWLARELAPGDKVGIDGHCCSWELWNSLEERLQQCGVTITDVGDPFDELWENRPPIPKTHIRVHPRKYAGLSVWEKFDIVRTCLRTWDVYGVLIPQLDDVAWLLNLRGDDVEYNPVFVAYVLLLEDSVWLYIDSEKLTGTVKKHLERSAVTLRPYEAIYTDLAALGDQAILTPAKANVSLVSALKKPIPSTTPLALIKARKNPVEVAGFHRCMERDGVALVKFMRWLKPAVKRGGVTEMGVDRKLHELRSEDALYRGPSFGTIAAYGDHGAIVHYEATPQTDRELKPRGFLLLDTGAQYLDGTTDITRTIPLGPLTAKQRKVYTLVLKAHIQLAMACFPEGLPGTNIDAIGRRFLWNEGLDYGHGTGHGVGSYLCVHEGPFQIRKEYMSAPLNSSMTVTNEPGVYCEGEFGVRIENVMYTYRVKGGGDDGEKFLGFEPLTLCPIDREPIILDMITAEEEKWFDRYHRFVLDRLMPLLEDPDDMEWLRRATRPLRGRD